MQNLDINNKYRVNARRELSLLKHEFVNVNLSKYDVLVLMKFISFSSSESPEETELNELNYKLHKAYCRCTA